MTYRAKVSSPDRRAVLGGLAAALTTTALPGAAFARSTAFMQSVAEAAARDGAMAEFYKNTGYAALWTGTGNRDKQRRQALVQAIDKASNHGLPEDRYSPELITANIRAVKDERDLGRLEVELSRVFLQYARDVQTGLVSPSRVDGDMVREVPLRSRSGLLNAYSKSTPRAFMKALPPKSDEYARLMKAKMQLERQLGRGGWGQDVPAGRTLNPGDSGGSVVALRNKLIALGYLNRTATQTYDSKIQVAVQKFQMDHGLSADGVAGPGTLGEINASAQQRLSQVMVAMERERWMNHPDGRGKSHIWVNLPDFHMRLYDNGRETFKTRAVVGDRKHDKRTPEFSDQMTYMEVNPDWTVPRSILGRDYLPKFKQNPYAARYLQLIDASGRVVSRDSVDFSQYTERNFPFTVRQAPGDRNALGRVKFMFPNPYAIYLHDTPQKHLFQRETRAYSSGCVRLNDPFDFAYELLGRQMGNPKDYFDAQLRTGRQTRIDLERPIPVHIVYRTAFTEAKGNVQFRRDFYGRDAKVWAAMRDAGVALRALQG